MKKLRNLHWEHASQLQPKEVLRVSFQCHRERCTPQTAAVDLVGKWSLLLQEKYAENLGWGLGQMQEQFSSIHP